MNESNQGPPLATSVWQLEFARLIAFSAIAPVSIQQEWWRDLTGAQPDDFVSTRKAHLRDDRGSFRGALLSVMVDVKRVVWEARSPAVVDQSGAFPMLGPLRETLAWFVELLTPWLMSVSPPLVRLAFSAKLLQPANTPEEAYRVLAAQLPAVNLDSKPDDFALQINRRRESSDIVVGLPINRVCTWSKMNVAVFAEPGTPFTWPERCYSALELDINTAPEKAAILPRTSLPQLFRELVSLGEDIAERGDIP
jgi:hypothetical protein